jgi:hypothetical protein
MGRKKKYNTEEEKKQADREKWMRYYERNKEKRKQRAKEKYAERDYVECKICGDWLKELTQHISKKHNITKSEYLEMFPGANLVSEKTRENKATMTGKKRPDQSERMLKNNPTKGRQRTNEEKELMSQNRMGKGIGVAGKYERTKDIRKKISESVAKLYVEGKTNFVTGHYVSTKTMKTCYYRSSWELSVMEYLDCNNNIEYWEYEPFYIPYKDENGDDRNYIPDFLVVFECGIKELWEIKPKELLTFDRNICKLNGMKKFIDENNMNGFVVDEFILEKLKKYMEGVYERIF